MSSVPGDANNEQQSPYKNPKKNEDEMKGTVLRPPGPITAATSSATRKQQSQATSSDQAAIQGEERPVDPSANEITLAMLEEHSARRARGYDPYNAGASFAAVEAWKQKRKRD